MEKKLNLINDEFVIENGVLIEYKGDKEEVIIPDGVIKIGQYAFGYTDVESVVIPEGVTDIDYSAFYSALSLRTVYLPKSIQYIELAAFSNCDDLQHVYYGGKQEDEDKIKIAGFNEDPDFNNDRLLDATWHYLED